MFGKSQLSEPDSSDAVYFIAICRSVVMFYLFGATPEQVFSKEMRSIDDGSTVRVGILL